MAIVVYADVIMPNSVLSAGVRGKQIRRNARTQAQNGTMKINVNWSRTLRQYELGFVPMLPAQWQAIEGLHEVTDGGAYGFLLEDPKDAGVDIAAGVMAQVTGTEYQLYKRYACAGSTRTKDRIITRPRSSGFAVKVSGTTLSPASYTLNPTTGRITIPSAPAAAALAWSGSFYVPVHFMSDEIDWDMVAAGAADTRLLAGPSVVLMEVRE